MEKLFELPYYISNGGDGSANLRLCKSLETANEKDQEQDEGWGESSAGTIKLKLEDGKLFYSSYESVNGKYCKIWIEISN